MERSGRKNGMDSGRSGRQRGWHSPCILPSGVQRRFVERGVCVVTGRRNSLAPAFWGRRHGPVKAALEASVRYLAHERGPKRIRVNAISAGAVATRAASGIEHFDELLNETVRKAPLHRTVDSCEVGRAALLLASDYTTGITGEVVHVDAGFHIQGMVFH
jgi:NAD(P)-dependent dehydrogenase (short-subunit alcohol dehydrogenase family)